MRFLRRTKNTWPTPAPIKISAANYLMELPGDGKRLEAVYVSGKRLIIGVVGSGAEVEILDTHLRFQHMMCYCDEAVILEFCNKIFHYRLGSNSQDGWNIKLISEIDKL